MAPSQKVAAVRVDHVVVLPTTTDTQQPQRVCASAAHLTHAAIGCVAAALSLQGLSPSSSPTDTPLDTPMTPCRHMVMASETAKSESAEPRTHARRFGSRVHPEADTDSRISRVGAASPHRMQLKTDFSEPPEQEERRNYGGIDQDVFKAQLRMVRTPQTERERARGGEGRDSRVGSRSRLFVVVCVHRRLLHRELSLCSNHLASPASPCLFLPRIAVSARLSPYRCRTFYACCSLAVESIFAPCHLLHFFALFSSSSYYPRAPPDHSLLLDSANSPSSPFYFSSLAVETFIDDRSSAILVQAAIN